MTQLFDQIKRHEGFSATVYTCPAGKLTIGYGRNLIDKGISKVEANQMLYNDLYDIEMELLRRVHCFEKLDRVRRDVLINMAFNLGVNGLLNFKKMMAAVNDGYFELAAKEMLDSKWAKQVGNRALELSEQMRTGSYSSLI